MMAVLRFMKKDVCFI